MSLLKKLVSSVLLISSSLTFASPIAIYNNKNDFLNDTGATSLTGTIPGSGNVGTSETLGDLTFSTALSSLSGSIVFGNWSTLIPGNEIAISGAENLRVTINLANTINAFGFDIHEPSQIRDSQHNTAIDTTNTSIAHDSTFTVELFNSGVSLGSSSFNPVDDILAFFGLISSSGFDRVDITENLSSVITGGIDANHDNEFYGQFYGAVTSVPEPSTLALLSIGLLGTGRRLRRSA